MRRLIMSRLIWIYAVCKSLLLSPVVVKELRGNKYTFKGGSSVKNVLSPSEKEVYSEMKEFAPIGSKFLPFRVAPFSEGA